MRKALTSKQREIMVAVIEDCIANSALKGRVGLCAHIKAAFRRDPEVGTLANIHMAIDWMEKTWIEWEHYSGNYEYPVPDPRKKDNSFKAYVHYHTCEGMWTGPYGKLRLDLCRFLLEELNKL